MKDQTRREFNKAAVGGVVAAAAVLASTDAGAANPTDQEIAEAAVLRTPRLSQEEIERIVANRVFLLVSGATFPMQYNEGMQIPVCSPVVQHSDMDLYSRKPHCNVSALPIGIPEVDPEKSLYAWRFPAFRVMMQVQVGTIDEMVELYRHQLTTAARTMITNSPLEHDDIAGSIEQAKEFGYTPGQAYSGPIPDLCDPVARERVDLVAKHHINLTALHSKKDHA